MDMKVEVELDVKIPEDRASANEIFEAVAQSVKDFYEQVLGVVLKAYQEQIVEVLCRPSGRVAKKGLGAHEVKGEPGKRCRGRSFERAGYWQDDRCLRGDLGAVSFRPAMVRCKECEKRLTPVLEALELESYQGKTDQLVWKITEAIADTSYRRGIDQLSILTDVPVAKSTAHQWAASVELPISEEGSEPFLGADATGFKKRFGQKGQVKLVLKIGADGEVRPLSVWAGTSWEDMSKELEENLKGQGRLLLSDGERGIDKWLGRFVERTHRCHWHLPRETGYALWEDKVPLEERRAAMKKVGQIIAIEIPEEDIEFVRESEKDELRRRIQKAEEEIEALRKEFESQGYEKAATYLENTRDRLFNHLHLWLETGLIAPRTASIVENFIRELVRRLKKVGWNWSDEGATRVGRIVMIRRYDKEAWYEYWKKRMNLRGRCQITLVRCERKRAA